MVEETAERFKDGSYIIYVNSKRQDDTELGRLMHDLHCADADKMYSGILADRVRELKHTQKGVERMCREMEQIYSEGEKRGINWEHWKKPGKPRFLLLEWAYRQIRLLRL